MQENSEKGFLSSKIVTNSELGSFSGGSKRIIKNVKFLDPQKINSDLKRKLAEALKKPNVRRPVEKREATESTNISSKNNSPLKRIQVISVEEINKSNIFDDAETIRENAKSAGVSQEKKVSSVEQEPKEDSVTTGELQMKKSSVASSESFLSQRIVGLPSVNCSQVISLEKHTPSSTVDIPTIGKSESSVAQKISKETSSTEEKKNIDVKNILNAKLKLKLTADKNNQSHNVIEQTKLNKDANILPSITPTIEDLAKNQLKEIFAAGALAEATTGAQNKFSFFGFTKSEIREESTKVKALSRIISNDSTPKRSYRKKYTRPNVPKRDNQANKIVKQLKTKGDKHSEQIESKEQSTSNVSHTNSGSQHQIPSELTSGIQLDNSQIPGTSNLESSILSEQVADKNQIISNTESAEELKQAKDVCPPQPTSNSLREEDQQQSTEEQISDIPENVSFIKPTSVSDFSSTNHLNESSVDEQYVPKNNEKEVHAKLVNLTKMVVDEVLPVKTDWENENTDIIVDMDVSQETESAKPNDLFTTCSNLSSSTLIVQCTAKQSVVKTLNDLPLDEEKSIAENLENQVEKSVMNSKNSITFNVQSPEGEKKTTAIQLAKTSKHVESVSQETVASPKLKVGDIIDISSAQLVCSFKPNVSDIIVPNVTLISSCPVTKNEQNLNVSKIHTESRLDSSTPQMLQKERRSFVENMFKPKPPVRTFDNSKDNRFNKEKSSDNSSQNENDSQSDPAFKTLANRITNTLGISETEDNVKLLKFLLPYINQTALYDELDKQQDKNDSKEEKHEIDAVDFLLSFQNFPGTPSQNACEEADEFSSSSSESNTFEQDDFDREDVTCLNTSKPDLETSSKLCAEETVDEMAVQLPCDKFLGISSQHFVDNNLFTKEYDKDTILTEENKSVTPEEVNEASNEKLSTVVQQECTDNVDAADQTRSNQIEDSLTKLVAQSPTKHIVEFKEQNTYEKKDEIENLKAENKISMEATKATSKDVSPVITEEIVIHNEEAITVPVCTQIEVSVSTTVETLPVTNEHDIGTGEVCAGNSKKNDCNGNHSNKSEAHVLSTSKKLEDCSENVLIVNNVEPAKKPFRSRKPKVNLIPARRRNIAKKPLETSIVVNSKVAEKPNLNEKSTEEQESHSLTSTSHLLISQSDKNCSEGNASDREKDLTNGVPRQYSKDTVTKREEDLKNDKPKIPAEGVSTCKNTTENKDCSTEIVTNVASNNLKNLPPKRSASIAEEPPKRIKCDHYEGKVYATDKQQINTPNKTGVLVEESVLKNVDSRVSDTNEQQPENPSEPLTAVNESLDADGQENYKSQREKTRGVVATIMETLDVEDQENYKSMKSITPSSSATRYEDCIEIDHSTIASSEEKFSHVSNVDESISTENFQIDNCTQGLSLISEEVSPLEDAEVCTENNDLEVVAGSVADSIRTENFEIDISIQGLCSSEEVSPLEEAEVCTEIKDLEVVADSVAHSIPTDNFEIDNSMQGLCSSEEVSPLEEAEVSTEIKDSEVFADSVAHSIPTENFEIDNSMQGLCSSEEVSTESKTLEDAEVCTENKDLELVADSELKHSLTEQKSEAGSTEENHRAIKICNLEQKKEESINYENVSNCCDSPTTGNVSDTKNIPQKATQYSLNLEQTMNDNDTTIKLEDRHMEEPMEADTFIEESSERMNTSNICEAEQNLKENPENSEAGQKIPPDNPAIPCIADNLPCSSKTLRNHETPNDIKVIDFKKDIDQDEDGTITMKAVRNDVSPPKDKKRKSGKSAPTLNKSKSPLKTSRPCKRKTIDTENDLSNSSASAKKIRIFYDIWSDPPASNEAIQNCDGSKQNTQGECSNNSSTEKFPLVEEKPREDDSTPGRNTNSPAEQGDFRYFSPLEKLSIDDLHPRLLLVDKIEDLEKPIKDGTKTISKGFVKCGACKAIVLKKKMNAHIAKHYYVGWIEGTETPVNLSSYREVLNKMVFQMKAFKVKCVSCRICGTEKKSAAGMLSHLLVCSETGKIKYKCSLCNTVVQRMTTLTHANGCRALKKTTPVIEESKKKPPEEACTDNIDNSTIECQISASGRLKRKSVLKAEQKFKEIAEEKFNPEMFIAPYQRPLQGQHFRWNKEIQKSGSVKCAGQNCDFTTKIVEDIKNHEKTCNLVWRSGYRCAGCKKFVAQDRESVVKHVIEVHKADSVPVHVPSDSEDEVSIHESSSSSESTDVSFEIASDSEQNVRRKRKKKSTGNKTNDSVNNSSQESLHTKILQYTLSTERDIAFNDFTQYVNMTIQFRKYNYYQEYILPQCTINLSRVEEYELYMPTNKLSIKYSYEKDKGWSQMELFKSEKSKGEELIFVGGPVTHLEWVPLPDDYSYKKPQYFVVVSKSNYNQYTKITNQKKRKMLIQVWEYCCQKRESKFVYSVAYDIGPIHHIAFLPSGGYAPDLNRLGVVAVSSVCSKILIFALPLKAPQNCDNMNNSINVVLDVKPFILLRLRYKKNYENRTHDVAECIQMVWSESKGHNYIFGGFSNGFVAIWDIEEKENMNKFIDNGVQIYVPIIYFCASELCITSMQIHYDIKGPRWILVTTENRDCKIFDLCDINMPTLINSEDALRSRALKSCWPVYWQNPSILLTEEYTAGPPCIMQKSPSNVLYKCRNNICLSANLNDISFSPWYNTLLAGTDNGDICVRRQYNTLFDLTASRWRRGRYLALTQIKRLDGEPIPLLNSKPGAEDAPELLKLFDRDYINKYGIIFKKLVEVPIETFDKWSSYERNTPYVLRDFVRVSKTSINTNYKTKDLYAVGYENGFIRIRSLAELYK